MDALADLVCRKGELELGGVKQILLSRAHHRSAYEVHHESAKSQSRRVEMHYQPCWEGPPPACCLKDADSRATSDDGGVVSGFFQPFYEPCKARVSHSSAN